MRAARAIWLLARTLLAIAAVAVFLFPLYWLVITALKPEEQILTYPPVWWPDALDLTRLAALLQGTTGTAIANSALVATASTLLAVALGSVGAYGVVRAGRGEGFLAGWSMASRMVPPAMLALPFFFTAAATDWTDSVPALTLLVALLNLPYAMWMMRGYLRDIPKTLFDAAEVAGLTDREIVTGVVWPMARGGLIATAAFTFLLAWNELVFALVLTGERAVTLPALLARTESRPELWTTLAGLSVIGIVPALVALLLMQRRLARSLSLGLVGD
jgi:multiple sugar transport system permease protein